MFPAGQRTLIPINIETLAGTSFELLVSPYEQIQYIKRKIEKREGIPTSQQHLIWKSTELDDQSCLHDYQIEAGTSLKLVLAMRGGPVNTKRVPIEDSFIRDMSEYIESSREDYGMGNDFSTNKNVTFLVLRDGDQFNFFQVIDRGDGTLSPLSSSLSATSMYNTHETITVEQDRQYDEKRQADDRKTKQKMDLIRSKLKIHPRKDLIRPPSASKTNLISHPRRNIHLEKSSSLTMKDEHSSFESPPIPHHRSLSYSFSANLFNTYNLLSTSTRNDFLHEEDSEEDDDDDDEDSHDEEEEIKPSSSQPMFTSRSFSPSMFYHQQHKPSKTLLSQKTATTTAATAAAATTTNDTSSTVLVDYIPRLSPTVPIVSTSSRLLSATKCLNTSDSPVISEENKELLFHHSQTELNDELPSRNDTSLSKPIWPEDDESIPLSDEHPSPNQPLPFRRQNSTTSTTAMTSVPTLPQLIRKPSLPSTTQRFYHPPSLSKSISTNQQPSKSKLSLKTQLILSPGRPVSSNVHLNHSQQSLTNNTSNETKSNTDSFNEHLMLNRRIEILKTPGKQQQPSVPSPMSTASTTVPPPAPSKRQDIKSIPTTPATSSVRPIDSTKVTIETIGPKTVSALLRQNATIEPVDTSRGVGKHLVSLLTTASRETSYKQPTRDAVIEERYKLDSKLANPWSNSPSVVSSTVQSNTAGIYNSSKLPPVIVNRKSTSKCFLCKKKTGLATTYQCRCGSSFCSEHRYPEAHACAFDYKAEGKRLIERNNPLITAPKLPKI